MHDIARSPQKDRQELFRETAHMLHLHEAIVEKDFWVCWILDYLFNTSPLKEEIIFKGGTSLSKVYNVINRFSEDIDLVLDWKLLGYSDEEPWEDRTPTQQDKFGQQANKRTEQFLTDQVVPVLFRDLTASLGSDVNVMAGGQNVLIDYPKAFSSEAIQSQIRLEIGPLSAQVPHTEEKIHSYAAECYPRVFSHSDTSVRVIVAERTFWEKATILHQEAHRSPDKKLPLRYSRHYYDMYCMSRSSIRKNVLTQIGLLEDVVRFKEKFYRCPWAKYDEAKPGSLRLLPSAHHIEALKKDYRDMQVMIFKHPPLFDEIVMELGELEKTINAIE